MTHFDFIYVSAMVKLLSESEETRLQYGLKGAGLLSDLAVQLDAIREDLHNTESLQATVEISYKGRERRK